MRPAAALAAAAAGAAARRAPARAPYTRCGDACTADGFAAGGAPGVWVGEVCPPKCAECQSDGQVAFGTTGGTHNCEASPSQMYTRPTYEPSRDFAVTVGGAPVDVVWMRDYVGQMDYAQFVLPPQQQQPQREGEERGADVRIAAHGVPDPSRYTVKPRRLRVRSSFVDGEIRLTVARPTYLIVQFDGSPKALMLFAEAAPAPPPRGAGVVSLADFGVTPTDGRVSNTASLGDQGDGIQRAVDAVLRNASLHTLIFPAAAGGARTYVTHDLHVTNHTGRPVELFFEEGVLLQRSGGHIGALTSPGFLTLFNSSGVTLRGLATLDALNGGQGLYVSSCDDVTVDGLTVRNTWWWNTEVEHSERVTFRNYKITNDPKFPFYQNDGLNLEHSTDVVVDRLFVASQDDLQCIKADPEDGAGQHGSYTPDIGNIRVTNMLGYNSLSSSLKVGWGATARRMYNVSYANIDIVNNKLLSNASGHQGNVIAFRVWLTHEENPVEISNFSFTNITYERQGIELQTRDFAHVRGVTLDNVVGEAGDFSSITVAGASPRWGLDGVTFRGVRVGGRLLTADAAARDHMTIANATGVVFEP